MALWFPESVIRGRQEEAGAILSENNSTSNTLEFGTSTFADWTPMAMEGPMVKSWATRIVCGLRDRLRKSQRASLTQDWLAVLLQHPLRTSR